MYQLIHYASFKDIRENDVRLELYKDTQQDVTASELVISSGAVTIDYNGEDDVFKPLKLSGCKVNILTPDILNELYSGKANEITLKVFRNDCLFWFGYLTPNIYSSDYIDEQNALTLEFVDTISILEHNKYEVTKNQIFSFWQIISKIFDRVDNEKVVNTIYLHKSLKVNDSFDLLNQLFITSRNFFDEENEPDTCKSVIEEITRFLGMNLIQFEDKYIFIDYDAYKSDSNNLFIKYDRTTNEVVEASLPVNLIDINSNIHEANASISLAGIYNKITVIASNNPIGQLMPELIDNEDLINQNNDPNKYYELSETIKEGNEDKEYILLSSFFKSQDNWTYLPASTGGAWGIGGEAVDEITPNNIYHLNACAFWQRCDFYKIEDGEPSSFKWSDFLTFYNSSFGDNAYLTLKKKTQMLFKEGYFILNLSYKMSKYPYAHNIKKTSDDKFFNNKYNDGFDNTMIPCRLAVGDYYYDGENFVPYQEYYDKVNRGYYKVVLGPVSISGAQWFRYTDEYGYLRYISQSEYDGLPEGIEKESGGYDNINRVYYFTNDNQERVCVTEEYNNECYLFDRFYLVHENHIDDKIFDDEKSLNNSVSYKMNLKDSEDGVAIKLPLSTVLQGDIVFQLFKPNHLGVQPCWATEGASEYCNAFHFSRLFLKYTTDKENIDLFSGDKAETDIKYENVINSDYVSELDDIELKVNTYNKESGSHSFVATKINDRLDYIEELYNIHTGETRSQEEHIVNKYFNYYSSPKFKYENSLKDIGITPLDILFENTMNKRFVIQSITYKLSDCSVDVNLSEV